MDYKINSISISKYNLIVDYEMPRSFPATKEEDKNDVVKRVQIDLDNYYEAYSLDPTDKFVKKDSSYYKVEGDSIRSRASIVLDPINIDGEPKELTLTFKEMKKYMMNQMVTS